MENYVARKIRLSNLAALLFLPALSAHACTLSLKPETSGFFLNPVLEKVVVVKTAPSADSPCTLLVGDELLQVNDRVIPGAKAKEIMAYWRALPTGSTPIFKVRRGSEVLTVAGK